MVNFHVFVHCFDQFVNFKNDQELIFFEGFTMRFTIGVPRATEAN